MREVGKLTAVVTDAARNDFQPTVRFVLFAKDLRQPDNKIFFLPPPEAALPTMVSSSSGMTLSAEAASSVMRAVWPLIMVSPPTRLKWLSRLGHTAGIRTWCASSHRGNCSPGLYQLQRGARLWIEKAKVEHLYATPATSVANTPPAAPGISPRRTYPISSGSNQQTKLGISNETFSPVQIYLDGSESPIDIKGSRRFEHARGRLNPSDSRSRRL